MKEPERFPEVRLLAVLHSHDGFISPHCAKSLALPLDIRLLLAAKRTQVSVGPESRFFMTFLRTQLSVRGICWCTEQPGYPAHGWQGLAENAC